MLVFLMMVTAEWLLFVIASHAWEWSCIWGVFGGGMQVGKGHGCEGRKVTSNDV